MKKITKKEVYEFYCNINDRFLRERLNKLKYNEYLSLTEHIYYFHVLTSDCKDNECEDRFWRIYRLERGGS